MFINALQNCISVVTGDVSDRIIAILDMKLMTQEKAYAYIKRFSGKGCFAEYAQSSL